MVDHTPSYAPQRRAGMWLRLILVVGTLGLLGATLFPFAPERPGPSLEDWKNEIARRVEWRVPSRGGIADLLGNVLLFVPLGFSLAGLRRARGARPAHAVAGTCVAAGVLSASIEVTQLLIPSRDPAVGDILANVAGALIGATAYVAAGGVVLAGLNLLTAERGSGFLSVRKLAVAFIACSALMFGLSLNAARTRPFGAWDADMPLAVGSGPHSWHGGVSDLLIADEAMTSDEADVAVRQIRSGMTAPQRVIAFYRLGDAPDLSDATGRLPPLVRRAREDGTASASGPWFESPGAGREVSRRVVASSQFTVSAVLAASDPGEWRVVSLASDARGRNLSLLQQDAHLLVRLNTPSTGADGERPQFLLPYLFSDGAAHRVSISFDGRRLRTFADGRPAGTVDMSPETLFIWRRLPFRPMYVVLGRTDTRAWRLGFDAAVFGPLGLLAGLLAAATRLPASSRAPLAAAAVLVPPAVMQLALSTAQGWEMDWVNAASGAAFAGAMALVAVTCAMLDARRHAPRNANEPSAVASG